MRNAQRNPCCGFPRDPAVFYNRVISALWYCLFVRVIVVICGAIGYYNDVNAIYLIATLVAVVFLVNAVLSVIAFYENVMHSGLSHAYRMVLVKISVGIIVVEGLIEQLLYSSGNLDDVSHDDDDEDDNNFLLV